MGIFENGQNLLGNLKSSAVANAVRKFAPFVLAGTVGYAAADLTILSIRDKLLPTSVPQTRNRALIGSKKPTVGTYSKIRTQNIFNSDGEIPPPLSSGETQDAVPTNEAVLSQLPLTLQGTIVHFNPERSIATIRLNRKNSTQSFIPGEEIEGMAKVLTVERRKVIFTNLNTGMKEYIEIPEKAAFDFSVQAKSTGAQPKGPVEEKGRNNFTVKRSEVERLTKNLSQLLQQARMEPRFGPDNSVNGFCFVSIQSGSIYETLGFRTTDCISKVNGEDVTSPQQAMELFQKLKTSSNIQLGVDRDGRSETFNYDIN